MFGQEEDFFLMTRIHIYMHYLAKIVSCRLGIQDMTLTPIAERLTVDLSLPVFTT